MEAKTKAKKIKMSKVREVPDYRAPKYGGFTVIGKY